EASNVSLNVYDITGRLVVTLLDGHKDAGSHMVAWDASSIASGVYFYKLVAGEYTATKSMNLLK
ncbi:MAG: T9SS type A sorting domain-containing protein, partial [Candidatus Zixiibacteriota bacterium]